MEIEVRYQSKSGNTEKVAREIAQALGLEAQNVGAAAGKQVDVLFLGGAIYAGGINKDLKKFLKTIEPGQVKHMALFSTASGTKGISAKVEKLIHGKNIKLFEKEYHAQSAELDSALPGAAEFAKSTVAGISG